MLLPGMAVVELSVLTIDRSPVGTRVLVSVEVLSVGSGSVQPAGPETVAVLDNEPVAEPLIVAVTVYTMVPPLGMKATSLMLPPVWLVEVINAPPVVVTLVTLPEIRFAGRVSTIAAPVAVLGPLLATVMV